MTILVLFSITITLLNYVLVRQVLEQPEHIALVHACAHLQYAVQLACEVLQYVVLVLFVALLYAVHLVVAFALYTLQIYLHRHAAYAPELYGTTAVIL